jgi:hypothetical protein
MEKYRQTRAVHEMNPPSRWRTFVGWLVLLMYLLALGFFGFRPFQAIPGMHYQKENALEAAGDGAVHVRPGGAIEVREGAAGMRKALKASGRFTLEMVLQTDSSGQGGPARIAAFSRNAMSGNFSLSQNGNALDFRLHTSPRAGWGNRAILVPGIFDEQRIQHLAVVFDGSELRLHVDGKLRPETRMLTGNLSGWERNHLLVLGDEPTGGYPWSGKIHRLSIYDRALAPEEISRLCAAGPLPGAVYAFNGAGSMEEVRPLRYRNVFVTVDRSAYCLDDCLANIAGFIPLAGCMYLVLPLRLKRRTRLAVLFLPVLIGLAISGAIEWGQCRIVGRVPALLDLAYNVSGVVLGGLLLSAWLRRQNAEQMKGSSI